MLDGSTEQPVADARIEVIQDDGALVRRTRTNPEGRFELSALREWGWTVPLLEYFPPPIAITATADDYGVTIRQASWSESEHGVTLRLDRETNTYSGELTSRWDPELVFGPGLRVWIERRPHFFWIRISPEYEDIDPLIGADGVDRPWPFEAGDLAFVHPTLPGTGRCVIEKVWLHSDRNGDPERATCKVTLVWPRSWHR